MYGTLVSCNLLRTLSSTSRKLEADIFSRDFNAALGVARYCAWMKPAQIKMLDEHAQLCDDHYQPPPAIVVSVKVHGLVQGDIN